MWYFFLLGTAVLAQNRVPEKVESLVRTAHSLWEQYRCSEAVPLFEQASRLAPDLAEPYFCLGYCYSLAHEAAKAESALRRYVELDPRAADGWAALGVVRLDRRQFAGARTSFERALEIDPRMEKARKSLLRLLVVQHDYKAALPHAEALLAAAVPDETAFALSIGAYLGLGAGEKALEISERGLRIHPQSFQLERLHITSLLDCGRQAGCRGKLVAGLERQTRSATSLRTTLAVLQDAYARGEASRAAVGQSLKDYPDVPAVRCLAAQWALVNRRYPEAISIARAAAKLPAADKAIRAQCLIVAGLAYEQSGDPKSAEAVEREADTINRTLTPPNPGISLYLVDLLANAGRTAEALRAAGEASAWSADFAPARLRSARLLEAQNQPEKAASEAEAALRLGLTGDEERAAHALLAGTYFALGKHSQARIHESWIAAHQPARQDR